MEKRVMFIIGIFLLSVFSVSAEIGIQSLDTVLWDHQSGLTTKEILEFYSNQVIVYLEQSGSTLNSVNISTTGVSELVIVQPTDSCQVIGLEVNCSNVGGVTQIKLNITPGTVNEDTAFTWDVQTNDSVDGIEDWSLTLNVLNDSTEPSYSDVQTSPSSPTTYAPGKNYQFNATWTDDVEINQIIFEFDGINYTDFTKNGGVYSRMFTDLAAGSYNYQWYAVDNPGNWNQTDVFTYVVNKADDTVSVILNTVQSDLSVTYGTETNATATSTSGTHLLFIDGESVSNPDNQSLGVGVYNYSANSTGNNNYSASAGESYILTVIKANSEVKLTLDGLDDNIIVEIGSNVNLTGIRVTGEGNLELELNGVMINSEDYYLENLSEFNNLGIYNISLFYPPTNNYSESFETHFITVVDTTLPIYGDLTEIPEDPSVFDEPKNYTFTVNWTDNVDVETVIIEFNNFNYTPEQSGNTFLFIIANLSVGTYNYNWYANDTSGNGAKTDVFTYTVNPVPPSPPPSSGGGGGGSTRSNQIQEVAPQSNTRSASSCSPYWKCTEWSSCNEGEQTRLCQDWNLCGPQDGKPEEIQSCEEQQIIAEEVIEKPAEENIGVGAGISLFDKIKDNWGILAGIGLLGILGALAGWKRKSLGEAFNHVTNYKQIKTEDEEAKIREKLRLRGIIK